jgi:hypothetical protein
MPLPETDLTLMVKVTGTPEFCGLALEVSVVTVFDAVSGRGPEALALKFVSPG